jgi:uroporphyrinogen-III synthase
MSRARPAPSLAEWHVISLRPLGLHAGVRRAASKQGARTFALSTLAIEPLAAGMALRQALACPIVIVTSPVAVRLAGAQAALKQRPDQRWFAVGPGTAAALNRQGIRDVVIPEQGADSDALLALPALAMRVAQEVGLVTAPGGRGSLAKELTKRGATVRLAEVYRRVPLTPAPHRLRALAALPEQTALLVSSGEALASLWRSLSKPERARLAARPCVASSERLAAQARALGVATLRIAASARPTDLVATLVAHAGARRFR